MDRLGGGSGGGGGGRSGGGIVGVLWIGSGSAVVEGVKALRAAGSAAQIVTLSNNASSGFIKQLGSASTGVIVTQVFPSERAAAQPMVKEAMALAEGRPQDAPTVQRYVRRTGETLLDAADRAYGISDDVRSRGIGGVLHSASAYFSKHPPVQMTDDEAYRCVEQFIRGERDC